MKKSFEWVEIIFFRLKFHQFKKKGLILLEVPYSSPKTMDLFPLVAE